MTYPTRKIGSDDVSAIGFGAMGLSAFYGQAEPDEERFKVLDYVFEQGSTLWDTADIYGDSEELIGKWFKRTGKRDQVFIATKFGIVFPTAAGKMGTANNSPEFITYSVDKSLKNLGIDTIDLYYAHRVDTSIPIEKTVGHLAELVKEGKVRYLGLSEVSGETLRRAHAVHPIAAVQVEYAAFSLDIEDEKIGLLKTARELGVAVIAYSPLGRGILTGSVKSQDDIADDDWRKHIPKFSNENFPKLLKLADGLERIGQKHSATAGQVALAWLLAQGQDIIPIPGTRRIKNAKENIDAVNVKLTPDEVAEVRRIAVEADAVQGDRYAPDMMISLFADTPAL